MICFIQSSHHQCFSFFPLHISVIPTRFIHVNNLAGLPQNDSDFPPPPPQSELTKLTEGIELRNLCSPAPPSPPRQAKTIVVSSNNGGETSAYYHSLADPEHYPDLLNIPQNRGGCYQGRVLSPVKTTTATLSGVKVNQPLNPAALVVPHTPPQQFPHQVLD